MADFEHEQLKTLFERLADRLDRTSGDDANEEQLAALRKAIGNLNKTIDRQGRDRARTGSSAPNTEDTLNDFFKEYRKADRGRSSAQPEGRAGDTILGQMSRDSMKQETKARTAQREVISKLTGAFKGTVGNLANFSKGLDGSMVGLAGLAGLGGGATGKLFGAIDENVEMYRKLRQSGESSVGAVFDMRARAQEFNLSTKQFSEAIASGTDGARALGAIRFGAINKSFRDVTASVGRFGLSIDDTLRVQNSYIEMLRNQGNLNEMDNGQIAAGMQQLVKSGNITASILGKTRDEVLKERSEAAKDANLALSLKGQGKTTEEIQEIVSQMGDIKAAFGQDAARAYRDIVTTGQVQGDNASTLANAPEQLALLMQAGRGARDGNIMSTQDLVRSNEQLSDSMSNTEMSLRGALGSLDSGAAFNSTNGMIMAGFQTTSEKANDGSETDRAIVAMVEFEETMAELNSTIQGFMDTIMKPLISWVSDTALPVLQSFTGWLSRIESPALATGVVLGGLVVAIGAAKLALFTLPGMIMKMGMRSIGGLLGRAGTGIGGRVLAGGAARAGAGVGAAALGTAAAAGAGVISGGLLAFGGNQMIANHRGESFFGTNEGEDGPLRSRGAGYAGSAAGGALAGAAIGSIVPVLGTAVGAAVGGALGLGAAGLRDFMAHREPTNQIATENRTNSAMRTPPAPQGPSRQSTVQPADTRPRISMEQIATRIATLTETGNTHLRMIAENNRIQLELMREEVAAARDYYSQSIRINEETNRALRTMGSVN